MVISLPVREENRAAVAYVGTTPAEGLVELAILQSLGCRPPHRVLEIGCGPLIAGFPLLQFLERGHYMGIDPNARLLGSTLTMQDVADRVAAADPSFSFRSDFRSFHLRRYDFILSHSVLSHASNDQLTAFLDAVAAQADEGCVAAVSLRLAEGNAFGSPGSPTHGAFYQEWTYPGVSWFRLDDVLERCKRAGLRARVEPAFTKLILAANPRSVHDWLVVELE